MKTARRFLAVYVLPALLVLSVAFWVEAKENEPLSPTPKLEKFEVIENGFRLTLPKEYGQLSDLELVEMTPYFLFCIMTETKGNLHSGEYRASRDKKEPNVVIFRLRKIYEAPTPRPPTRA